MEEIFEQFDDDIDPFDDDTPCQEGKSVYQPQVKDDVWEYYFFYLYK
jgi:hypothetical protein